MAQKMHHRDYTFVFDNDLLQLAHNQRSEALERLERIDQWLGQITGLLATIAER